MMEECEKRQQELLKGLKEERKRVEISCGKWEKFLQTMKIQIKI